MHTEIILIYIGVLRKIMKSFWSLRRFSFADILKRKVDYELKNLLTLFLQKVFEGNIIDCFSACMFNESFIIITDRETIKGRKYSKFTETFLRLSPSHHRITYSYIAN